MRHNPAHDSPAQKTTRAVQSNLERRYYNNKIEPSQNKRARVGLFGKPPFLKNARNLGIHIRVEADPCYGLAYL